MELRRARRSEGAEKKASRKPDSAHQRGDPVAATFWVNASLVLPLLTIANVKNASIFVLSSKKKETKKKQEKETKKQGQTEKTKKMKKNKNRDKKKKKRKEKKKLSKENKKKKNK